MPNVVVFFVLAITCGKVHIVNETLKTFSPIQCLKHFSFPFVCLVYKNILRHILSNLNVCFLLQLHTVMLYTEHVNAAFIKTVCLIK